MDFHTLWEDADPEISILKQAKAEYAQNRGELCEMNFSHRRRLSRRPLSAEPGIQWLRVPPTLIVPLSASSGRACGSRSGCDTPAAPFAIVKLREVIGYLRWAGPFLDPRTVIMITDF